MTEVAKIAALAIVGAVLALVLKEQSPGFSLTVGALSAVAVLLYAVPYLSQAISFAVRLYGMADGADGAFRALIRVTGISLVCHMTSDIAKDAGQNAVASATVMFGRVLCMCLCLPQMESVLALFASLLPPA
ncbi:MAG: stage III sporulation AC/AD family protein [Clostridia bacterium]|nr:stage III sporulation AC/AD family protein [Clostridia bacterium]